MAAGVVMVSLGEVWVCRAAGAGVLGAATLQLFLAGPAPLLGLKNVDYPALLGTFFSASFGQPQNEVWILAGWLLLLAGGIVWALIYAYRFCNRLPGPGWLQGLTYGGLGVFLVSSLLFFPLMGFLHPLARSGQIPSPGLFGVGLSGERVAVANFLGHCLFGIVVGAVYRRRLVFS